MKRTLGAVLVAAAITAVASGAPAQADFAPPLGNLGKPAPPPGTLYNHNGVGRIDAALANSGGSAAVFIPTVRWSARTKGGTPVSGTKCGIEVTFPGQRWPMYKSKSCQGSARFSHRYTEPGRYAITVVDRISGSFDTVVFDVFEK
jgi:hypothetical protein